jgi:hypothetical protein
MRHLVDLVNKVAVITWWEKNVFPYNEECLYRELYKKKYNWKWPMTDEEEKKLEELKALKGEAGIKVESIQITDMLPVESGTIKTTFTLTGHELKQINDAIEKLQEPYKGRTVTIGEEIEVEEY